MAIRYDVAVWVCSVWLFLCGCASEGNLNRPTQAQIVAITTREVDASHTETFKAAIDALFDAGYTIDESDREGGILTGFKKDDRSAERLWISPYIEDTVFRISVLVRERGPESTAVRLSMSRNGEPYFSEALVDEFWRLMRRQVMMHAPPPPTEP